MKLCLECLDNGRTISSCVSPNSCRAVLSLKVAPLRCHSESRSSIGPLVFGTTCVGRVTGERRVSERVVIGHAALCLVPDRSGAARPTTHGRLHRSPRRRA
jgi:hypothetical protein